MIYGKSSQDGTPTPENPVEIKSVVNPTVKVCGKNLSREEIHKISVNMSRPSLSDVKVTSPVSVAAWVGIGFALKIAPNTQYTISTDASNNDYLIVGEYKSVNDVTNYNNCIKHIEQSASDNITFTSSPECNAIVCCIMPKKTCNISWTYWQIELGSTPTTYEPYHEQTVALPYTLNAIPVSSGGNVTIDGQQYIADYIDVENGKIVKYVKKLFLKPFQWSKAINKGVLRFYASTIDAAGIDGNKIIKNTSSISSHFAFVTSTPDRIGTFTLNADGTNANVGFAFSTDTTITSDDFNNWILNNKPFVFLPVLKEELPLTLEQILALKKLSTYYPVTNIFINSEQLDGYTVFNYPISMENGWNYVKQQIGDTRDYIYDMDLQSAEAYVNSEYAVALTELEV